MNEQAFIDYVKPILKAKGFKKTRQRWTKDIGEFTISFLIQGSSYDKDNFYIRPGVYINALMNQKNDYYGDFHTELTSSQDPLADFEIFYTNFTNKEYIKNKYLEFLEWDKRNPLEKRRTGLVDYEKDPVPSDVFFSVSKQVAQYIIDNF